MQKNVENFFSWKIVHQYNDEPIHQCTLNVQSNIGLILLLYATSKPAMHIRGYFTVFKTFGVLFLSARKLISHVSSNFVKNKY